MASLTSFLYFEEIEPGTPGLDALGLLVMELSGDYVDYAVSLPPKYGSRPSHNDYLALALAKQEGCDLLTGDQDLRRAAFGEKVGVKGSIWLLCAMVENHLLTVDGALAALDRMHEAKRRLPWAEAERILNGLRGIT